MKWFSSFLYLLHVCQQKKKEEEATGLFFLQPSYEQRG